MLSEYKSLRKETLITAAFKLQTTKKTFFLFFASACFYKSYFTVGNVTQVVVENLFISRLTGTLRVNSQRGRINKAKKQTCQPPEAESVMSQIAKQALQRIFSRDLCPRLAFFLSCPRLPFPLLPPPPPAPARSLSSIRNDGVTPLFSSPISLPCYITCVSKHPLCLSK